jgi:hypothetical protein
MTDTILNSFVNTIGADYLLPVYGLFLLLGFLCAIIEAFIKADGS